MQKNRLKVQSSRLRQASINSSRNSERSKYGEMVMRNSSGFEEKEKKEEKGDNSYSQ